MKPRFSNKSTAAMTLFEVGIIIAILGLLAAVLLPMLANVEWRSSRINCVSNLKQDGIAFRLWEGDNNDKYPMAVSVTNGGAMEWVEAGNVAACFQVMSNELSTPRVLLCPEDTNRTYATRFSIGFGNTNISYFVGLDADESYPQRFLSGDDNFARGGVPVKSGRVDLSTNVLVSWTEARHHYVGNLCFADGSAQQLTTNGLQQALQQTGLATNRLVLP
jgi:hypothetical protein